MMIGKTLSRYTIESPLGRGGMGEVFQAHDPRLDRSVAIKILPKDTGEDRLRRFMTEARAASALNHPNIVTVHDVDHDGAVHFIVMEKIDGKPLSAFRGQPMDLRRFLDVAIQISGALGAAHTAGIVHRDIKPANVMITDSGVVKVVDFGLARLLPPPQHLDANHPTVQWESQQTAAGAVLGTIGYMAPEQVQGQRATERSDVFSLGLLFYELLSGHAAFDGDTPLSMVAAILRDTPPPLDTFRSDVPHQLSRLIDRCLAKEPAGRYASAAEVHRELLTIRGSLEGTAATAASRRRWPLMAAVGVAVIAIATMALWWRHDARIRWVREGAPAEVERLIELEDPVGAFQVVRRARAIAPDDTVVQQLWTNYTRPLPITSDPPGAEVSIRNFVARDAKWLSLGRTPLQEGVVPFGLVRYRVALDGYIPTETAPEFPDDEAFFRLHRPEETPEGMVAVEGGEAAFAGRTETVPAFWIDRFEVSNAEYKRFVDAGGYQNRELWTEPFVDGGAVLALDEAMERLVDTTGRPGPSVWELGSFPEGRDDHPVEGVSWYEAMAYARFAGKDLPTVFHWKRAAAHQGVFSDMVSHSNFAGKGTWPVGSSGGLGAWGTHDMAGNVKEWCRTSSGTERYTLGGSWSDASYQFTDLDAQSPFERRPGFGFRLVQYRSPLAAELKETIPQRAAPRIDPVDDATFAVFKRMFDYEPGPLNGRVEEVDDSHSSWRMEKVSFDAAYGGERVTAYLFLPRNSLPPFQTIVFFPGSDATYLRSSRNLWLRMVEFHMRAGRAVVYPVYQGTYERRNENRRGAQGVRERVTQRTMDARRTVDYLEKRSDIDEKRLAYYGLSLGANMGPFILASEPRFRGAILFGGGIHAGARIPEFDSQHYLPRVTLPVLFIGGRNDFAFPLESSQRPYFELLGTPAGTKRHFVFEGGHIPVQFNDSIREMLSWCDEILGPVTMR
jgi:eukaryotic-like serine/threonine-protein kinase